MVKPVPVVLLLANVNLSVEVEYVDETNSFTPEASLASTFTPFASISWKLLPVVSNEPPPKLATLAVEEPLPPVDVAVSVW